MEATDSGRVGSKGRAPGHVSPSVQSMKHTTLLPLLFLAANPAFAQQVTTTTLPPAAAVFAEPFTQIVGIRELADGRVIIADPRERTLALLDFRTGQTTRIGREGQGPGEWRLPNGVFALPGDSTLVYDVGNMRYMVVDPRGNPAYTFSLAGGGDAVRQGSDVQVQRGAGGAGAGAGNRGVRAGAGAGAGNRGAGAVARGGGSATFGGGRGPGAMVLRAPTGLDAQGRLYFQAAPVRMGPRGPEGVDSVEITRIDRASGALDTLGLLHVPGTQVSGSAEGANQMRMAIRMSGPFEPRDDWAVSPDGRLAIVRHSPFRVEWVAPAGTVTRGPELQYTPIPVTDADRKAVAEARRSAGSMRVMAGPEGTQVTMGGPPPDAQMDDSEDWPSTKPPFMSGTARVAPNGHLWLQRSRRANDRAPVYDVYDGAGRLVRRVALPEDTKIIGFGARSVYLIRTDSDDLQYLQRVDVPGLLGAN